MTGQVPCVAVLGATSHIARSLLYFSSPRDFRFRLFARSPHQVAAFLSTHSEIGEARVTDYASFGEERYDVVVNCVGIGGPRRLARENPRIFSLTERFDTLVLEYLERHPETLYLALSSGAVFGGDFAEPAGAESPAVFHPNSLSTTEFYGIAKLNAEARHRALPHLRIVDARVFGFFTRFIDVEEHFFLNDVVRALRAGDVVQTDAVDMVRDYLHPRDLVAFISLCFGAKSLNAVFDLYSRRPVGKFELLEEVAKRFGLRYEVIESETPAGATGFKKNYYSVNRSAQDLGYQPRFSSMEGITLELKSLLETGG